MKTRRAILLSGVFTGVLFLFCYWFLSSSSDEGVRAEGDHFSVADLHSDEEIVVATLFSHRNARGRKYRLRREDEQITAAIFDTTPGWARDDGIEGPVFLQTRAISEIEAKGLDETIAYCRQVRKEVSSATRHLHLRYFRRGIQVGEEFYIGFSLPSQLAYLESEGYLNDLDRSYVYQELVERFHINVERLLRMVAFETLEIKKVAQPGSQHYAGDRPPIGDSPASDTPSSPAPRG